ncbi:TIGR03936 family radical SAM-associated protein [Nocardioides nanhaiensis]|uniref:TIGR03936 family radical SAM-associated protein n=1 Tax=Nocardioides nanhaiensis TaxID=1476871 RepID=A0ABP8W4R7_9ACTN
MSRQQPEQQAPPVQRLRVRYAKRGRLRFTSHRDVSRAVERAIFRARVPMAYSSGFNPHPRISYAGAAPTGAASEAEYLELALSAEVEPAAIRASLDEALPPGLDVLEVVVSPGGGVADRLEASLWHLDVALDHDKAARMVAAFLAEPEVPVERMTKKGLREFDCRGAVVRLEVAPLPGEGPWSTRLELLLRHAVPAVRPDDVLTGLAAASGQAVPGGALLTRLAQGPFDEATSSVGDPLG